MRLKSLPHPIFRWDNNSPHGSKLKINSELLFYMQSTYGLPAQFLANEISKNLNRKDKNMVIHAAIAYYEANPYPPTGSTISIDEFCKA